MRTPAADETRSLSGIAELTAACTLYREVFGFTDPNRGVNPRLLRSLQSNGGSVVGTSSAGGDLVAFAYGFLGASGGQSYHYSQAAVVARSHQGRGLGRALKLAQREVALAGDTVRMRWTFDPALARNAHFNLDVLGARGRWFERDFYGEPDSDRMTVEWDLERIAPGGAPSVSAQAGSISTQPAPAALGEWCVPRETETGLWLSIPADLESTQEAFPAEAAHIRRRLAEALETLLDQGYAAVSCIRLDEKHAAYRFEPVPAS